LGFANNAARVTTLVILGNIWGDPVVSIGAGAFQNTGLVSVTIPNGVAVGEKAFWNNSTITSITIGANVAGNPFGYEYSEGDRRTGRRTIDISFMESYQRNGRRAGTYTRTVAYRSGSDMENYWVYGRDAESSRAAAEKKRSKETRSYVLTVILGVSAFIGLMVLGTVNGWFESP
jgi:hypothetical protein